MTMYQLVLRGPTLSLWRRVCRDVSTLTANSSVSLGLTKLELIKTHNTTESN